MFRASFSRARSLTAAIALLAAFATAPLFAQSNGAPWTGVDEFGRRVVSPESVSETRPNKTVGLFYFLWLDPTTSIPADVKTRPEDDPGPYDLSRICENVDPNPTQRDDLLGTNGQMHFWGQPLFGYYDSRDPWVVRRHMQLIADAGVDVLIFDTTNAVTYPHVYLPLCDLLLQMKEEGAAVPQVTFMTNTRVDLTVQKLWDEFYSQEKYKPLFFQWEGKTLLIANPDEVPEALRDKFTFRTAYWPTLGNKNTHDEWHWVAGYPQPYSWSKDEQTPEEVNVSTSQNLACDAAANPVWMSWGTARGRSFVWGAEEQRLATDVGLNFAQQWTRAYELDPPFVMITGWNEWIAGRWKVGHDKETNKDIYAFVDQFNYEYSRDVEPTRNWAVDSYYLQMVDGIRKYKGAPHVSEKAPVKSIDISGGFEQWADVAPELRDYINETIPRDYDGCAGLHYKNDSGRNDLAIAKVARDDENVYFYMETREAIRPEIPNNLCLALDADGDLGTGWRGVDLLIGREYNADGTVAAERYDGKAGKTTAAWTTKDSLDGARWAIDGNRIQISVPLAFFGDDVPSEVSFKWLDNVPLQSAADLYDQGDVAPESAFFYNVAFEK